MDKIFSLFSSQPSETSTEKTTNNSSKPTKPEQANVKKNISSKKKPFLSLSASDESIDFSVHYKNKVLTIYLYIIKKGVKESWKAKLNEEEMNKLFYNLFLIFSNPEPFHPQLQAVYPNQQLEPILHVNPNPVLSLGKSNLSSEKTLDDSLAQLALLINK
jgi:hypothetical protein